MYKLVAIDIDGTLLNDQQEITPEVKESILRAKEKGVKIVLCTGRPLDGIQASLNILNLLEDDNYAITMNGAIILSTKTKKVIQSTTLKKADLVEIFNFCEQEKANVTYLGENNFYVPYREIPLISCQDAVLLGTSLHYMAVEEVPEEMRIAKVMLLDEPMKIEAIMDALPESFYQNYYVVRSVPYNLEFLHKNVSKGTALKQLTEKLGLKRSEVMCIGDAENDVTMLEYAGMPVVMGNAADHIKALAKFVTTTNNENGVCTALTKFL